MSRWSELGRNTRRLLVGAGVASVATPVSLAVVLTGVDKMRKGVSQARLTDESAGDIVAVRQGNVLGTSFHPELTNDARIHTWWLQQLVS